MSIHPWQGIKRTAYMLFKKHSNLYHPYFYLNRENAEKQVGWFGDEVHRVRIIRVKEKAKCNTKTKVKR